MSNRILLLCLLLLIQSAALFGVSYILPSDYQKKLMVPEPILDRSDCNDEASLNEIHKLRNYFYIGDSLFISGQLNASCAYYEKAANCAHNLGLTWAKIICYNRTGFARNWLNQFEESKVFYMKSMQEIKKTTEIKDTLAWMETHLFLKIAENNISQKEENVSDSLFYKVNLSINSTTNTKRKAKFYFIESRYDLLNDDYNRLKINLNRYRSVLGKNTGLSGIWLFYYRIFQADYYATIHDFPLARQYYLELQKQAESDTAFTPYKYLIYNELCVLYNNFLYFTEAEVYTYKILSFIKDRQNTYYYYDFLLIGYVYERLGKNDEALSCYNKALSILKYNRVEDKRLALVFWYLASYHRSVSQNTSKQLYYVSLAKQILDNYPDSYLESFVVRMLGSIFTRTDGERSITLLNPLLKDLDKLLNNDEYFQLQCPFIIRTDYQGVLNERGKAFYYLSKTRDFDSTLLKKAYLDFQNSLKLSLKIFNTTGYEDSKVSALNALRSRYDDVFNVGYTMYQNTGNNVILPQLFNYSEDSKAYLLKNYLSDEMMRRISGISDEELAVADKLKKEIDTLLYLSSRQQEDIFDQKKGFLIDKILEKSKAYDEYIHNLEIKYPKYASMKQEKKGVTVDQVQKNLDPSQVLLEYFFNHNSFYTFYLSCDTFGLVYQPIDKTFPFQLIEYRKNFENFTYGNFDKKNIDAFTKQSYALYKLAIKPVEKLLQGKRLLIVPDAELGYIPLETLITENPDSFSYGSFLELPYLLVKNPISYLYSASQVVNRNEPKHKRVSYVGFAPNYESALGKDHPEKQLVDLPGAEEEIYSAKEYYGGKTYLGGKVNKEKYFQAIQHDDIVHLAMHTVIDEEEPRRSMLLFSPDIESDNLQLHTYEVYSNKIRSSLVVLSACNTGTGKMNKGEGIFSIARSFLMAGITNVIYTQWSVTDRSSAQLMKYFYFYLSEGYSVDRALQQAKIDLLTKGDPAKANPYYWAGYVNMGMPVSLPANKNHGILYLGFVLCGLALLIFIIRRRN